MQVAVVNGVRSLPEPKTHGLCQYCGNTVISKCGPKVIWHWAHFPRLSCDPWWENETQWHRDWKSRFPEEWRELVLFDPVTNEKHIADIKTDGGLVIEFQNSAMPLGELRSRESFYGDMIWVVNGVTFKDQFHILDPLPDPTSEFGSDLRFWPQRAAGPSSSFWRLSENPAARDDPRMLVRIRPSRQIADEIWDNYVGHHLFDWTRPRTVWYESSKPVFFDFGDEYLYLLKTYDDGGLTCVQKFGKGRIEYLANRN